MTPAEFEVLLAECMQYLGIADDEPNPVLQSCIRSAVELCENQTGAEDSPLFRQLVKNTVFQLYSDRGGELNNKQGSALSALMQNARLTLRLRSDANDSNDTE